MLLHGRTLLSSGWRIGWPQKKSSRRKKEGRRGRGGRWGSVPRSPKRSKSLARVRGWWPPRTHRRGEHKKEGGEEGRKKKKDHYSPLHGSGSRRSGEKKRVALAKRACRPAKFDCSASQRIERGRRKKKKAPSHRARLRLSLAQRFSSIEAFRDQRNGRGKGEKKKGKAMRSLTRRH